MVISQTIAHVLKHAVQYLKSSGITENLLLDAQLLLCHLLKKDRIYLIVNSDEQLNEKTVEEYKELLKLRAQNMPLQYIVGSQEFMSLPFKVTRDVLIPRADTETLTEHVINYCKSLKDKSQINIIDIGTGSGCIAVSLAYYICNSFVWAVDISKESLKIAEYNAKENEVNNKMIFLQHDILTGFPNEKFIDDLDIIVSNPPYIKDYVIQDLQREVKDYQPYIALSGGQDGLIFYRKIIDLALNHLKVGALLVLEVGHDQSDDVIGMLEVSNGFENIVRMKDLSGINRVVSFSKKQNILL